MPKSKNKKASDSGSKEHAATPKSNKKSNNEEKTEDKKPTTANKDTDNNEDSKESYSSEVDSTDYTANNSTTEAEHDDDENAAIIGIKSKRSDEKTSSKSKRSAAEEGDGSGSSKDDASKKSNVAPEKNDEGYCENNGKDEKKDDDDDDDNDITGSDKNNGGNVAKNNNNNNNENAGTTIASEDDDEDNTAQQQQRKQQQRRESKDGDDGAYDPSRTSSSSNPTGSTGGGHPPSMTQQTTQHTTTNTTTTNTNTTTTTNINMNNTMDAFDDDYSDAKDTLLTMTFNQDGGCLAVGTGSGFRICNAHPFQETFRRSLGGDGGGGMEGGAGIAHIEMLYRTNLLALTGHSTSPHYPPNKVLIYDDHLQRTIGELSFRQRVLTTKLRRDRIVVVLRDRVYIYNFSDLALLDKVHTGDNPLGLIGISMDNGGVGGSTTSAVERAEDALGSAGGGIGSTQRNNGMVLACPGTQRGQVRVELYGLRRTTVVDAHESALGALALSVDGSLLATASERGTVIRLFDTRGVTIGGGSNGGVAGGSGAKQENTASVSSSVPLREFRRGVERATISCLTFSLDSNWLGCASNHGTVHIFQTQESNNNNNNNSADSASTKKKRSSMTGKAMRMLPKLVSAPKKYLMDGVQSYAQVRGVPYPRACAFVPDRERTIAVAGMDDYGNGCLLLAEFGPKPVGNNAGGAVGESKSDNNDSSEARRLGYHRFFKCKSPSSQSGSSRRRTKSKEKNAEDTDMEGGAYIDDAPVDMRMNHISIGDENEDDFVPIDYNNEEK